MKKGSSLLLLTIFLTIILSLSLISSAENTTTTSTSSTSSTDIEKSYSCLKDKLGTLCGNTKNTDQLSLTLLAMGYDSSAQSDCKRILEDNQKNYCFPASDSGDCNLKSTSLAALALSNIGNDVHDITDWILSKERVSKDLDFFIEIDSNIPTQCKISVNDGDERKINVNEDKKITGSPGSCLSISDSGYFLKISSSCYEKNFTISCDEDFISTILYKKSSSSVYYVSSETHSAASEGETNEKARAYCFSTTSSSCDYEGSLWATLALVKTGHDVSEYIPYLTAMSDESENRKFFPETFLYILTSSDDYYSQIIGKQKQSKYWQEISTNSKYYDSSLALLALQNSNSAEFDDAKQYFLDNKDSTGCWNSNNIRDTAFLLYAGWPKSASVSKISSRDSCESFNHYCIKIGDCASSDRLDNFYCSSLSDICCNSKPAEKTCSEKEGIVCKENQECTGSVVKSSDSSSCCLGSCIEIQAQSECEDYGYSCADSCTSSQEEKTAYKCNNAQLCCGTKVQQSSNTVLIVILLALLIILLVLAIIFRNQLKIWLFKVKSKFSSGKGPAPVRRPPMPPNYPRQGFGMPRQIIPSRALPPKQDLKSKTQKDKDFEETMKKLKDLSK